MDVVPYAKNNRIYLPIRYVGYAMGLTDTQIQWNEATAQKVVLTDGSTTLLLTVGSRTMFRNSESITMDVSPEVTDNRIWYRQ